jgi:hypothetical protein
MPNELRYSAYDRRIGFEWSGGQSPIPLFLTSVIVIAIADGGTTIPDVGVGLANNARDEFVTYATWRRHDSR